MPNIYGQTPLDICLGLPIKKDPNGIFKEKPAQDDKETTSSSTGQKIAKKNKRTEDKKKRDKDSKKEEKESSETAKVNTRMAEQIFIGMKDYGFMHSSHFTTAAVI